MPLLSFKNYRPVAGRMLIFGKSHIWQRSGRIFFIASRVPPCRRKKKMIKEPNDQITYLEERTGRTRLLMTYDWGFQLRSPYRKLKTAAAESRVVAFHNQKQVISINSVAI